MQKTTALTRSIYPSIEPFLRSLVSRIVFSVFVLLVNVVYVAAGTTLDVQVVSLAIGWAGSLPGAEVTVYSTTDSIRLGRCITNSSGICRIGVLAEQRIQLIVSARGYLSSIVHTYSSDRQIITIRLRMGSTISGVVTDDAFNPLGFAHITAIRQGERLLLTAGDASSHLFEATSNSRGEYRIHGLPPGTYLLSAHASRAVPSSTPHCSKQIATAPVSVHVPFQANPQTLSSNIVLSASLCGSIEGNVTGLPDGEEVLVSLVSAHFPWKPVAAGLADASHHFQFPQVVVGQYTIFAVTPVSGAGRSVGMMNSETLFARQSATVSPSSTTHVALSLLPPIEGVVSLRPTEGSTYACSNYGRLRLQSVEAWGGRHEISEHLQPGGHAISVLPVSYEVGALDLSANCVLSAPRFVYPTSASDSIAVAVTEPATVRVSLEGVDRAPTEAEGDFVVVLTPQEELISGIGLITFITETSNHGDFRGIPPGSYTFHTYRRTQWDDPSLSGLDTSGRTIQLLSGINTIMLD